MRIDEEIKVFEKMRKANTKGRINSSKRKKSNISTVILNDFSKAETEEYVIED